MTVTMRIVIIRRMRMTHDVAAADEGDYADNGVFDTFASAAGSATVLQ